jgi:hypothetical protein
MNKAILAATGALAAAWLAAAPARAEIGINLTEKNPLRDEFFAKACKKDPAQVQAVWGKLIFTGTGTPPAEVDGSAAMKKAVAGDPNAVGYIDKKDADASVKVIATAN